MTKREKKTFSVNLKEDKNEKAIKKIVSLGKQLRKAELVGEQ